MIVYDKKLKRIVIPNGIGNINLFNNGVEIGYNQGKIDGINRQRAKIESINNTENGTYSIDDQETLRSIAFDGYSYFDTGIFPTENIKIEACIKITNGNDSSFGGIIIGGGIGKLGKSTENRGIAIGMNGGGIYGIWGAIKSRNKPYKIEGEGTTTVVLQKTNDSWVWDGEKGSFGACTLYIGGYNSNDLAVEKKFLQSIVYIKIWTDRNDDSTLITYTPKTNGNFDANGVELQRLGDGTTTFVKENVKKYPYGFKRVEVNVPDLNGSYNEGYEQGKIDGVNEQKTKLESISITENGTYDREDGYNHIEVNVPDLNGSYDEGYEQGQADVAANARVLNVTENGSYVSKYTKEDEIVMPFDLWGDDFYSYAYVKNKIYNTGIIPNENTRLEFWFKPDEADYMQASSVVIMNNAGSVYENIFGIFHQTAGNQSYSANVGGVAVNFNLTNGVLYHIVLSVADGLVINDEQIGTFSSSSNFSQPLYINGMSNNLNASADGEFGMIKIDDTIIIPTENGFLNQNTNELLEVVYDSGVYKFTEINKPSIEGNLYRTINVDVIPKINVKEAGIKFCYSTFTEVPEWADFSSVTDLSNMVNEFTNLEKIPILSTLPITDLFQAFRVCYKIETIPFLDTYKVKSMNS